MATAAQADNGRMHRAPPAARVEMVRDTHLGVAIEDGYRWMERPSGEFDDWLDEQARYARGFLAALPEREELFGRLRQLRSAEGTRREHFAVAGDRIFYLCDRPGAAMPVLMVAAVGGEAAERVLVDPDTLRDAGDPAQRSLDWYVPSPDGRYVAFGVSAGGSERSTLRVVEVAGGHLLPDAIDGAWFAFVSWLDDAQSLVYHRFLDPPPDAEPNARRLDSRSLRHRLGADPATDEVVLARGLNPRVRLEPVDRPFLYRPTGSRWTVAIISHGALRAGRVDEALSDCTLYVAPSEDLADPARCRWRLVAGPRDGVCALALGPDMLYLVTHRDAPRRRVLAVPPAGGDPSIFVPESERVIEAVRVIGDHVLIRELDDTVTRLRRAPVGGGAPQEIELPVDGTILQWCPVPGDGALLDIESWLDRRRLFRYDAGSATVTAARLPAGAARLPAGAARLPAGAADDPGSFDGVPALRADRLFAPARDGTRIPISLIFQENLRRDGGNPVWLVGYGSHGVALTPAYEPHRIAWLERGGIWAIAHLRGGGEYGRGWHEAGRLLTKENTVTDFIDCAEYLISQGYTRPDRLIGVGTSAGGIPAGGALVRRPELWAAMILNVPLVNSLRAEFTESGPVHTPELGTAGTEDGLRSLLSSDVYHRVRDGVAYPPVLLTAGRNDSRVPVWQPAKMAARLQAVNSTGQGGPTLLRVEDAGHGYGSTAWQRDAELADAFAFALAATRGLPEPDRVNPRLSPKSD
jgi:prolyl oligopeptidase